MRVVVVGGGFYGASVAVACADLGDDVTLIESSSDLLQGASALNQARVHGGYHYPRARNTALRSRVHYSTFLQQFSDSIDAKHDAVYAIARESKTTALQFERIMGGIDAPMRQAPPRIRDLFSERLIAEAFVVEESVYNVDSLRNTLRTMLNAAGVDVRLQCTAMGVDEVGKQVVVTTTRGEVVADFVVLATYGQLFAADKEHGHVPQLHCEPCEMLLVELPDELKGLAVTVMDGPFFSVVPYPTRGLHTLSHVRYTPHGVFQTHARAKRALRDGLQSRSPWMLRDAARYIPAMEAALHVDSLWSVKVVAADREFDDARPVVVEGRPGDRIVSVLGSKIDNVTDAVSVVHALREEALTAERRTGVLS